MDIDKIIFECTEHDRSKRAVDDCDICDTSGLIVDKMPVQQTIVESVDIVSSPTKQFLPLDAWRLKAVFDMYGYKADINEYIIDVSKYFDQLPVEEQEPSKTIVLNELKFATQYNRDSAMIEVLASTLGINSERLDSMWKLASELPA